MHPPPRPPGRHRACLRALNHAHWWAPASSQGEAHDLATVSVDDYTVVVRNLPPHDSVSDWRFVYMHPPTPAWPPEPTCLSFSGVSLRACWHAQVPQLEQDLKAHMEAVLQAAKPSPLAVAISNIVGSEFNRPITIADVNCGTSMSGKYVLACPPPPCCRSHRDDHNDDRDDDDDHHHHKHHHKHHHHNNRRRRRRTA